MRQAGRSLPEYRELRVGNQMLDACLTPELSSEITLQPVRRHGVDAAIFFSDIVIPVKLAGVDVEIVPGRGPVLANPVRTASDVAALRPLDPDALAPIRAGVAATVAQLGSTPLIGFAGAPFTLASYLVEGGPSKDQQRARTLMFSDPHLGGAPQLVRRHHRGVPARAGRGRGIRCPALRFLGWLAQRDQLPATRCPALPPRTRPPSGAGCAQGALRRRIGRTAARDAFDRCRRDGC